MQAIELGSLVVPAVSGDRRVGAAFAFIYEGTMQLEWLDPDLGCGISAVGRSAVRNTSYHT